MEAIVLAGGLGTRLREAVPDLPKPMAPVGGRPFLSYILDQLVAARAESAILAVGYRHDAIQSYFGDHYGPLDLRYSVESEPLGTGGAIRRALELATTADVFVLNGDTYLELNHRAMLDAHRQAGAVFTMAICQVADASRYGTLQVAGDRVTAFRDSGRSGPGWINAGTYLLSPAFREYLTRPGAFSFERDILAANAGAIDPLAYAAPGLFIDIGIPADYERAQTLLGTLKLSGPA